MELSRSREEWLGTGRKSLEDLLGGGWENLLLSETSGARGDFGGNFGELGISTQNLHQQIRLHY